ncbi:uncharacterized protein ARMOST_15270 [Armillaria ostoyae]|uniref:Uncharacterized protein n=1 Tax=Armillaria ostoyae TaxID=47428 RepID=A0A284RSZ0_ARMOS|nr:uncharacterized protein ARMOST_15270 [Armillaria ostoyae]
MWSLFNVPNPFRQSIPIPPQEDNDPLNANRGDYTWPELSNANRQVLGPHVSQAWDLRFEDVLRRSPLGHYKCETMDEYLALTRGDPISLNNFNLVPNTRTYDSKLHRNNTTWRSHYMASPYRRGIDQIWMGKMPFQDWTEELIDNRYDHYDKDLGDYIIRPLPDSPNYSCIRQHGQYHGLTTSILFGGGDNAGAGGSDDIVNKEAE